MLFALFLLFSTVKSRESNRFVSHLSLVTSFSYAKKKKNLYYLYKLSLLYAFHYC